MAWRAWLTPGRRDSLLLVMAVTLAYGLDYLFNLAASRQLDSAELASVIALNGLGQIAVVASRVIQTVVTQHTVRLRAGRADLAHLARFFRQANRLAWRWGGLVALGLGLLSPALARFLRIPDARPAAALALAVWLMAVRPVAGGLLQGRQQFGPLGVVQIVQAAARLGLGIALMAWGWGATGAMLALPLASLAAQGVNLAYLRDLGREEVDSAESVPWRELATISTDAALGLLGFAWLMNMDVILARRFFAPDIAGVYSAAVILGRVVQFFPLAIILVMLPKSAERQATDRDPAGVLLPAFLLVAALCGGVAALYFLWPASLIRLTVGPAYVAAVSAGHLLGWVGVGMALMSLANVWLNYFLALEQRLYIYLVWLAILLQTVLFAVFHANLLDFPRIIAANGLWLTLAGGLLFWRARRRVNGG